MLVAARSNKSDRATMFDPIGIGMNPLVPLRRNAEQDGPGKSGYRERGGEASSAVPRIHCVGLSSLSPSPASLIFGANHLDVGLYCRSMAEDDSTVSPLWDGFGVCFACQRVRDVSTANRSRHAGGDLE